MKKYNIALLPKNKSQEFISITENFSNYAANYVIGQNSLPHVTICHFEAEEWDIEQLWLEIVEKIRPSNLELTFNDFSCITFDKKIFWVSLLPNRVPELKDVHKIVSRILGEQIKLNYDPHLTLFNTYNSNYISAVDQYKKKFPPNLRCLSNNNWVRRRCWALFKNDRGDRK